MPSGLKEAESWLSSLELFGIKLGLDQTRELFRRIGNPERKLKFIHVAGSNGKGSVCALLDSSLRAAGFKTGFYSSPHLVDVRERFRVCGKAMSEEVFVELVNRLRPHVEAMRGGSMQPTYFEATTAIAAMHFADSGVDFAVWETGMGGRLDATNIVSPVCSAITGISLEHQTYLGDTLERIAFEKAGIIKQGIPVFCGVMPKTALNVMESRAKELGSPLFTTDGDACSAPAECGLKADGTPFQRLRLDGLDIELSLAGSHQRRNAALALKVLRRLSELFNFDLRAAALEGFSSTKWPARLQFIPGMKMIIDGAHNPEGAEALSKSLPEILPGERFDIILGSFSDKDSSDVLRSLAPLAFSFTFVPVGSSRPSRSPEELAEALKQVAPGIPSTEAHSLSAALEAKAGSRWRLVCGSLHLCGEALAEIHSVRCLDL